MAMDVLAADALSASEKTAGPASQGLRFFFA